MKNILISIFLLILVGNIQAQDTVWIERPQKQYPFLKEIYKDFLKYGTVYATGDISNSVEAQYPTYILRTNDNGSIYSIPRVEDATDVFPFDYTYNIGIRKLARFDYERKPKNFYDGNESQLVYSSPTSAVQGLEYQLHFERERWNGRNFNNHRVFLKHTGKYHIVKAETREVGKINLNYKSAETRARLPIGEKFSLSAGAIVRGHDRAYGYNPFEIWLNEMSTDSQGNPYYVNQWYQLGRDYGYKDVLWTQTHTDPNTGDSITTQDWFWCTEDGTIVANTDLEFREEIFPGLITDYNRVRWDALDPFVEIAPIIGFDFYHYKGKFWLHAFGNWILPYHKYIAGSEEFSYLNRNNWGAGGLEPDSQPEQWNDFSAGASFGWKVGRNIGIFAEGEYMKMWDSRLFQSTFGINYTFK